MKKIFCVLLTFSMVLSLFTGSTLTVNAQTLSSESDSECIMTVSEFLGTADESVSEDALSQLYSNYKSGFNEDGSVDKTIYDFKDNTVSQCLETLSDEEYPSAFDLRHFGGETSYNSETKSTDITGGLSYVTPVKLQNPWGTCWAFGTIAACESSILYEADLGTEDVDNENIDLSEHHLSWFAKNHLPAVGEDGYGVNDVNNQEGEGMWYISETPSKTMEGGFAFYGTKAFSNGIGVVTEDFSEYCGKDKMVMARRNSNADKSIYTEKYLYYDSVEAWEAETDEDIKSNYFLYCYSDKDDWSIDESERFTQTYKLQENNVLPNPTPVTNDETGETELNVDAINAIKSELMSGKAVQVSYYADNADPSKDVTLNTSRYINKNYAHYTWDMTTSNHLVCIVGWDDDYDASNFGNEHPVKYDEDGRAIYKLKDSDQELTYSEDEEYLYYVDDDDVTHEYQFYSDEIETVKDEDGSDSVPKGNGAWIVKNSWGAATNDFPNYSDWGVGGTGYFYLSYYDTSIDDPGTYDFAVTDEEIEENSDTITAQYDYLTSSSTCQSVAYSPTAMANVFTASEDMEITAVSCETTTPGTSVVYGICVLEDGEDYPSNQDVLTELTEPVEYKYGGFHKLILDKPVSVSKGQKYAVIAKEYIEIEYENESYTYYFVCANEGYSKESCKNEDGEYEGSYDVGVINPGESFLYTSGYSSEDMVVTDYFDFVTNMLAFNQNGIYYVSDNFSIKAYGNPVSTDTFSDISDCSEFVKSVIEWAANEEIVQGYSDGTFKPSKDCSRLEIAIMLWRLAGKPEPESVDSALKFTDTQELTDGAKKAIAWAVEQGIIKGFSDGSFRPDESASRQQTVIMLWRMAGKPDADVSLIEFTDTQNLSNGAKKAIAWAVKQGITKGVKQDDGSTKFNPETNCQRQHIAVLLYRYKNYEEE